MSWSKTDVVLITMESGKTIKLRKGENYEYPPIFGKIKEIRV